MSAHAHTIGSKCPTGYVTASDIAKLMRADIKAAVKAGTLPGVTRNYSVRVHNYSMGRAIYITAKGLDGMYQVCDGTVPGTHTHYEDGGMSAAACHYFWCRFNDDSSNTTEDHEVLTVAGKHVEDTLQAIHSAYNYNNSDSMTDYYDVNYSGIVSVDKEEVTA